MATCSVVFTKISSSSDVIDANLVSSELASGAASTASPAEFNYVILTPLDGNMWAAFTTDGSVPNASVATARIPLVNGVPFALYIRKGTRVAVLDRA
ncbi:hypothetical protein PHIN3_313 [Sinorhizobium phage phiN3]|uniref:Uncharacterized protein n=1 Tax=Sinorhizobium phage phiN3 TaxID=1647405 RepID=A0A0F6WCX3_9CAUD|nr:hypothetical protein AVT40_gp220 [Sinorhizobium phage phiN3]AKF13576.1 hypothetical protein PHIN3_313 [Sinorhizobium phage phiN3]